MGDWCHEWELVEDKWKAKYALLEAELSDAILALAMTRPWDSPDPKDHEFGRKVLERHKAVLTKRLEDDKQKAAAAQKAEQFRETFASLASKDSEDE